MTSLRRALPGLLVLCSCSYDLDVPTQPQRGGLHGVLDTQGHIPAGGNTVTLVAPDTSKSTQTTDADGGFAFGDLPPGLYYVDLKLPGFAEDVVPDLKVVAGQQLDIGTVQPTWLASTPQQGVINGKVIVMGGGDPTGGQVEFYLQPVNTRVALAAIGLDGGFVQQLPPGTYDLRAEHPLYVTGVKMGVVLGDAQSLDLSADPIVLDINPASLDGDLLEEVDGLMPVPCAGATVTFVDGTIATSDANGHFSKGNLPAGTQTVRITKDNFHDPQPTHTVTLPPGGSGTLEPVQLMLDRGTIAGTVALGDHTTALDVNVAVTGTPYNSIVTPDATSPWQGTFQMAGVPVGTYEVSATKARYSRGVVGSVMVKANTTTNIGTITLALLQGDFGITGDLGIMGYTRTPQVTLNLSGFIGAISVRTSEDNSFAGVAFSPFTGPMLPFTLTSRQGTHTVYAQYKDASMTVSPTFSSSIVLDGVAPQNPAMVISSTNGFTKTSNPLFLTLTADESLGSGVDAVSGLATVLFNETGATTDGGDPFDGGVLAPTTTSPYQHDLSFTRAGAGDGPQQVWAQFVDHAGNVSVAVKSSVVIDTQPPSGSLSILNGAAATAPNQTNSAVVTLTEVVNPEPNGGYTLIRIANTQAALPGAMLNPTLGSTSWFLDPSTQGPKTIYAQLQDAAGNVTDLAPVTINYDTVPPSPISVSLVGPSITKSTAVTLSLSAMDSSGLSPSQAVTASENAFFLMGGTTVGPQPMPAGNQLGFTLSAGDGQKTIYVRYRDVAGNDAVGSVTVTLDTQPPAGSFTITGTLADGTPSATLTSSASVSVNITQSGATGYVLGNETLTTCPASVAAYSAIPAGPVMSALSGSATPRQVRLCLTDAAGNTLGPLTQSITLDSVAPSGCALALSGRKVDGNPAPAGKTASLQVTASVSSCSETPTDIFLTTNAVTCTAASAFPWQPYQAALIATLSGPDGVNTLQGCVRDAAHNTSGLASGSITLDTTPPLAPSLAINNGAAYINAAGSLTASVRGTAAGAFDWALSETGTFSTFVSYTTANPTPYAFSGQGLHTLFGIFRDDVGNASPAVQATITVDTVAPAGGSIAIVTPAGNAYTNNTSVVVSLTAPSDAATVALTTAAGAACAASDFASVTPRAVAGSLAFVLPAGDGLKRVCAQLYDAAGNGGGFLTATVTLDTVAPTAPIIITPSAILGTSAPLTFAVNTSGPVTETNFSRYEQVSNSSSTWQLASSSIGTTAFTFTLQANGGAAAGVPNLLQLRAVDLAGNVSAVASVTVTLDTAPPNPPQLNKLWVTNMDRQATVFWQPNVGGDNIVGYNVYYGSASGSYSGKNASNGPSPVRVGVQSQVTLAGLTNGSPAYVVVKAVDWAGNESTFASAEAVAQPNTVSPDWLGTVNTANRPWMLARSETTLYVVEWGGDYNAGTGGIALQAIDVSSLVSPVQGGAIVTPAPALPPISAPLTYNDGITSYSDQALMDVQVDGNYLYTADANILRIFDISVPMSPVLVTAINIGAPAQSIQVRGQTLFVSGVEENYLSPCVNGVTAIDLGTLFDNNAATHPTLANQIGSRVATGYCSDSQFGGLTWTRNQLVEADYESTTFNITNPLARLGSSTVQGPAPDGTHYMWALGDPIASGNMMYVNSGWTGFTLTPLANVWAGASFGAQTPLLQTQISGNYPFDMAGGQVFVSDLFSLSIKILQLDDAMATAQAHTVTSVVGTQGPAAVLHYGNYLFAATGSSVDVFEIATPRSIHTFSQVALTGQNNVVSGAFLYSYGNVVDLQGNVPPPVTTANAVFCTWSQAYVDDNELNAAETTVSVLNLENGNDRNAGTLFNGTQAYNFAMPAGVAVTAIASWGGYLVFAERRAAGTYLEVYDAKPVRDHVAATSLSSANAIAGSLYQVTPNASASGRVELYLYKGRAFVTIDGAGQGIYAVDLRPVFDDNAATTLTASSYQGMVAPAPGNSSPRSAVVQGNTLYFASDNAVEMVDVSAAMDENSGTTIPASPARAAYPLLRASAIDVKGSYLVAAAAQNQTTVTAVLDVSAPLSPKLMSSMPGYLPTNGCSLGGYNVSGRPGVSIHGSRAYISSAGGLTVYELE